MYILKSICQFLAKILLVCWFQLHWSLDKFIEKLNTHHIASSLLGYFYIYLYFYVFNDIYQFFPGRCYLLFVWLILGYSWTSQVMLVIKSLPANARDTGDVGLIPGLGRSLEEGMATHSSILAWRIWWTEEPGGLQAIGSQSQTSLKLLSTQAHMNEQALYESSWNPLLSHF